MAEPTDRAHDPAEAPPPAADPVWTAYGDTILVFPDATPSLAVDLRRPIDAALAARLRAVVGAERFGVVTPENPAGVVLDAATNAVRLRDFAAELARDALHAVRVDGCAAEGEHVEHGYAIVAEPAVIRAWSARCVQTAFFWFDGTGMWLCPTRPDAAAHALPVSADVLAAAAGRTAAATTTAADGAPAAPGHARGA